MLNEQPELTKTRITGIGESWIARPVENVEILCHSMIEVPRPQVYDTPDLSKEESRLFWIEPRSLRPFQYSSLRTETPDSDPNQQRRKDCLKAFDNRDEGQLFMAGHYVYGERHYSVVVDIPSLSRNEIGNQIATWVASICDDDQSREKVPWERQEGRALKGDISIVLMPLHSQIHHLWQKIEAIIARRGRRQPSCYLDATLLYGSGPSYRMPPQLRYQIGQIAGKLKKTKDENDLAQVKKFRILILDDAMISGRTVETIISNLLRLISEFTDNGNSPSPVEWIRYFSILNQCSYARNEIFQNMTTIGGRLNIKIVFEDFAPFMGIKTYDSDNCPSCQKYNRLLNLQRLAIARHAHTVNHWIDKSLNLLYPIAVDGLDFLNKQRVPFDKPLNVLSHFRGGSNIYTPIHADTAIWQFHELMYLNQPPSIILAALSDAFPENEEKKSSISEYERYRWAVLDWCIRNWEFVRFDRAESIFFETAKKEVNQNTSIVPHILEGLSTLFKNQDVLNFIAWCLEQLAFKESNKAEKPEYVSHILDLDIALTLFFLSLPDEEIETEINKNSYVSSLDSVLDKTSGYTLSLLRNLRLRLGRDSRYPQPDWALSVIGETLFRGDRNRPTPAHPVLLPRALDDLVINTTDQAKRRILEGSLSAFLAAVEDLSAYSPLPCLSVWADKGSAVMNWLSLTTGNPSSIDLPAEYDFFRESLDTDRKYCDAFNKAFHISIEELKLTLEERKKKLFAGRNLGKNKILNLSWSINSEDMKFRILTHADHLVECIVNLAFNPATKSSSSEKLSTKICIAKNMDGSDDMVGNIYLTILTQFDDFQSAIHSIRNSPHIAADRKFLSPFGLKMFEPREPSDIEKDQGYTTAIDFSIPLGFTRID